MALKIHNFRFRYTIFQEVLRIETIYALNVFLDAKK